MDVALPGSARDQASMCREPPSPFHVSMLASTSRHLRQPAIDQHGTDGIQRGES
jgi:hypothetical protein